MKAKNGKATKSGGPKVKARPIPAERTPRPTVDPNALMLALLGWMDALEAEVGRVADVLNRTFRTHYSSGDFHQGFEFVKDLSFDLLGLQEAIEAARPVAPRFRAADLEVLLKTG